MAKIRAITPDPAPTSPARQVMDDLPENVRPKDAAAFLTISVAQLALWRAEGIGPKFSRLSKRRIIYRAEDLRAFVTGNLGKGA